MNWSFGVTSTSERVATLLPDTLKSLSTAGFENPRVFVDGASIYDTLLDPYRILDNHAVVFRGRRIRAYGNWLLALLELYVRQPKADRYVIFQDDVQAYKNLRDYLESCEMPEKGYWNLYTFRCNEEVVREKPEGWYESSILDAKNPIYQSGRGALGLVFSREAVMTVLTQRHTYKRIQDETTGHLSIDGGVITAMNEAGWREWIHNPSLLQHFGYPSTVSQTKHRRAMTWRGQEYDARQMIPVMTESS